MGGACSSPKTFLDKALNPRFLRIYSSKIMMRFFLWPNKLLVFLEPYGGTMMTVDLAKRENAMN